MRGMFLCFLAFVIIVLIASEAAEKLSESQCRPVVKVYCGVGRTGQKALVNGEIQIRCVHE